VPISEYEKKNSVSFEKEKKSFRGIVHIAKRSVSTKGIKNLVKFEVTISFGANM
jgi:hypothetical protein